MVAAMPLYIEPSLTKRLPIIEVKIEILPKINGSKTNCGLLGNNNDPKIIKKLQDSMLSGKRVRMHYEQKYFKYFWLGDTEYYVTSVEVDQ